MHLHLLTGVCRRVQISNQLCCITLMKISKKKRGSGFFLTSIMGHIRGSMEKPNEKKKHEVSVDNIYQRTHTNTHTSTHKNKHNTHTHFQTDTHAHTMYVLCNTDTTFLNHRCQLNSDTHKQHPHITNTHAHTLNGHTLQYRGRSMIEPQRSHERRPPFESHCQRRDTLCQVCLHQM